MYLVCYDISSNKYRKKAADTLLNYGRRVQFSVFECELGKAHYKKLCAELKKLVEQCGENVNICIFEINKNDYAKKVTFGNPQFVSAKSENVIVI